MCFFSIYIHILTKYIYNTRIKKCHFFLFFCHFMYFTYVLIIYTLKTNWYYCFYRKYYIFHRKLFLFILFIFYFYKFLYFFFYLCNFFFTRLFLFSFSNFPSLKKWIYVFFLLFYIGLNIVLRSKHTDAFKMLKFAFLHRFI